MPSVSFQQQSFAQGALGGVFSLVLCGRSHASSPGGPEGRFWGQQGPPYPHCALRAELLPRLLGLGAGPIGIRVQVQTLPSKGTRPFPLLKVLAGLLPEAIRTES